MADKLTLDRFAMKNKATAHLRIYVGGLTDKATTDEVYEHFMQYGQINGIIINRNFGFVQFENESSAQAAINQANGSTFQGKSLCVRTAQTQDKTRNETESEQPTAAPVHDSNQQAENEEGGDDLYDNFGNYIGDQEYVQEEGYNDSRLNYAGHAARGGPMRGGPRGRGIPMRGGRGGSAYGDPIRGHDWQERGNFDRFHQPPMPDYPRKLPVPERNDCEIIVVSKTLTEYAEFIEGRLKRLGIVVDLLFPMEDVPLGRVLGNIASRGCLYAIMVMPQNEEHRSLTLNILHGIPQEHRNMPLEDALQLISRNFQEVQRGGSSGREAVYALLGQLADGRTLTVLQYDKVLEYLQERKEQQMKLELGEPLATATTTKTQVDLQQRILSILNEKQVAPKPEPILPISKSADTQSKLLNDPTVRKALDSILQKYT